MATLDDDLANAVTEGFRQAQIDIVNQDLILSGTGDVTVTLADGSKKTGPSWSKLITAANAAGTSAAAAEASAKNAKTSETNANSSKTAAATSASNAKTSETNAKTSETNAKTSETNAKTSENNAKTSETNAAAALAAAQLLTSVPYEEAPFPDVWLPLNDDMRLLAGSASYDTLTISGQVLELPTKSATFLRATAATYFDKSGVLQTAAINEPRFERGGLIIEGQSTNYILNSDDPAKWTSSSTVTRTVLARDGISQAITGKCVINAATNFPSVVSSGNITLAVGESITISCRAKGNYGWLRLAFTLDGSTAAATLFDAVTGAAASPPTGVTVTSSMGSDGYATISATLTATTAGVYTGVLALQRNNADPSMPVGSEYYIQMPQVEKNPISTSYIPTGSAAVTRTADNFRLQPSGNIGYRMTGDLFNRTLSLEFSIDKFVPPSTNYHDVVRVVGANNDIIIRAMSTSLRSYRGGGGPIINTAPPFFNKTYVQTIDSTNRMNLYFDGKTDGSTSGPTNPASIPTLLEIVGHPNAVYHIRNFRIWHRVLTLNQINGLR